VESFTELGVVRAVLEPEPAFLSPLVHPTQLP
jgi:hypothetical protein